MLEAALKELKLRSWDASFYEMAETLATEKQNSELIDSLRFTDLRCIVWLFAICWYSDVVQLALQDFMSTMPSPR